MVFLHSYAFGRFSMRGEVKVLLFRKKDIKSLNFRSQIENQIHSTNEFKLIFTNSFNNFDYPIEFHNWLQSLEAIDTFTYLRIYVIHLHCSMHDVNVYVIRCESKLCSDDESYERPHYSK